ETAHPVAERHAHGAAGVDGGCLLVLDLDRERAGEEAERAAEAVRGGEADVRVALLVPPAPEVFDVPLRVDELHLPERAEQAAAELSRLHLAALDGAVRPDLQLDRERGRAGEAVAVVGGGVAAEHVHGDLARAAGDGGGEEVLS